MSNSTPASLRKPAVSVIIPVYNVAPFLAEAVESLLNQTLEDLEIVLVEDGSTDGSQDIVSRYADHDKISVVAHPANRGLSAARNSGIAQARGEYIGFLDGDDWADPDMYRTMYASAVQHHADVVKCGFLAVSEGQIVATRLPPYPHNEALDQVALAPTYLEAHQSKRYWFSPLYLLRRKFLTDRHICFDESIPFGEDTIFNLRATREASAFVALGQPLYKVRQRSGSMTSAPRADRVELLQRQYEGIRSYYEHAGLWETSGPDVHSYILQTSLPESVFNTKRLSSSRRDFSRRLRFMSQAPFIQEALRDRKATTENHKQYWLRLLLRSKAYALASVLLYR